MKKLSVLLLIMVMMFALAACGGPDDEIEGLSSKDLEDLDDAFEVLEQLKPEGWDENSYGMYIYDVWDTEFLPDIFPDQVEGTKVSQTNFKDYKHDVLGGNYSVGPIWFDAPENYREYTVSFYATAEQLDSYVAAARADGFTGGETTSVDDEWREFTFYHADGWLMHIFFNTNDDDDGNFDGCASVSLTDSLFERPAALAGVKLPTAGTPEYDYLAGSCYEVYDYGSGSMESVDVDWKAGFPNNEECSWYIFFTYYGADVEDAIAYTDSLKAEGWSVKRTQNDQPDEYRCTLYNGTVYMVVNCYNDTHLEIGFSDMEENLSY